MNIACGLIFNVNPSEKVEMKFFDMYEKSGEDRSKAETLFSAIGNAMKKRSIGWNICICITVDNTNLNIG